MTSACLSTHRDITVTALHTDHFHPMFSHSVSATVCQIIVLNRLSNIIIRIDIVETFLVVNKAVGSRQRQGQGSTKLSQSKAILRQSRECKTDARQG